MERLPIRSLGLSMALLLSLPMVAAAEGQPGEARQILLDSRQRHDRFPHVFERLDLITIDRHGRKNVRKARRYWRLGEQGGLRFLWVFEQPPEIRGVAIMAQIGSSRSDASDAAEDESGLYLPAFGATLKRGMEEGADMTRTSVASTNVLGTDFSIQDLSPEDIDVHDYQRMDDLELGETAYFQIRAIPRDSERVRQTGFRERVLLIRKDTRFIERVDYVDRRGRLVKRLTRHDLKPYRGQAWRAAMSLMEDFRSGHRTLIKVRERVDSKDYVPLELFRGEALFAGRHLQSPEQWALAGPVETQEVDQ